MKRKLIMLLAALMALTLALGSCGATAKPEDMEFWSGGDMAPGGAMSPDAADSPSWNGDYSDGQYSDVYDSLTGAQKPTDMSEKMIYTADVTVETTDFDAAVQAVQDMVSFYGAFLESSRVTDLSYAERVQGVTAYRRASYVIRVPASSFDEMTESVNDVGYVVSSSTRGQNITAQFYDTQSRRNAYGIEQERLLAMLEKCQTVTEMIEIESRLSDVRYQIESLETTLRGWQNQVDYSTVNLTLREVEKYTEKEEPHRSYWEQIGDGFLGTLRDVGDFFKELFKDLVVALPVIVLVGAVAVVALVLILRAAKRRRAARRAARDGENRE